MSLLDVTVFPKDFAWGAATAAYQIEGTFTFIVFIFTIVNVAVFIEFDSRRADAASAECMQ